MKNFLGKLWALPTTFIGISIGFVGLCIAPRKIKIKFAHNAICFYNHPVHSISRCTLSALQFTAEML